MAESALDDFMNIVNGWSGLPYGVSASVSSDSSEEQSGLFSVSAGSTTISQTFTLEELEFIAEAFKLDEFVTDLINDCITALHNAAFQKRLMALHRGKKWELP